MPQLVDKMLEESQWNYLLMLSQELLRISDASALVRKEWEKWESLFTSKVLHSIELSMNSWLKEEISLPEMEQVVSLSMVQNSRMKTSSRNTHEEETCQWQMLDQTPTFLNSSYVSFKPHGLMENMLCLVRPSMALRFLMLLNQLDQRLELQEPHVLLQNVVNFHEM